MNQDDGMVSFWLKNLTNHGFSCAAILTLPNSQNLCGSATTRSSPAERFQEVGVEEKNLRPKEARQRAAESFLEVEDFAQVRPVGRMGCEYVVHVVCLWRLG